MRVILKHLPDIRIPIHNTNHRVGGWGGYKRWGQGKDYTIYNNQIFEDTLKMLQFGKTSSGSPYMDLQSVITDYIYPMRWMQMKDFLLNGVVDKGVIRGIFTFDLKWNYYTLVLVDLEALPKLLTQYELKGPIWWEDQTIIEVDH